MFNLLAEIHGQTPVATLNSLQHVAATVVLTDQMEAQLVSEVGENDHQRNQCIDALANSLMPDMTVYEWMVAAARVVCIDAGALRCI